MFSRTFFGLGLLVALAGCPPEPYTNETLGSDDVGGEDEFTLEDYIPAAEQAYCGWVASCGGAADAATCEEAMHFDVAFPTGLLAEGGFFQEGTPAAAVAYVFDAVEAGQLEFDAEAAQACLAWVKERGCGRAGTFVPGEADVAGRAACEAALRGTMVNYGPCMLSVECAREPGDTAVCGFDPNCTDMCCVGSCRLTTSAPAGSPCGLAGMACAPGTYCASDPMTGTPTVCTAYAGAGAPCPTGQECGAGGSWCDFSVGAPVCRAPVQVGGDCSFGQCVPGSFCGWDGGTSRCMPFAEEGKLCQGTWTCAALGNYCNVDGVCAKPKGGGGSCYFDNQACQFGFYCESATERCEAAGGEGDSCGYGVDQGFEVYRYCQPGLQCDGGDLAVNRCRAPEITGVCPVPALLPAE